MTEPRITRATKYDGKGYWRDYTDIEHRGDWVVVFMPTYAKSVRNSHILNRVKLRVTWFFTGYGANLGGVVKKKLLIRAAEEKIVHLYIHRTHPPMSDEEIRFLEDYNEEYDREHEKTKKM